MAAVGQVWKERRWRRHILIIELRDITQTRELREFGKNHPGRYAKVQTCTEDGTRIRSAPYGYIRLERDGSLGRFAFVASV